MTKRLAVLMIVLVSPVATADDLTIPNTFTPGTPARAADVNANFAAVEASVDDNAANIAVNAMQIAENSVEIAANTAEIGANTAAVAALSVGSGVMVYSQGTVLGRFLSAETGNSGNFLVLSDQGFVYEVSGSGNPLNYLGPEKVIYFSEANCVGESYIANSDSWEVLAGSVFNSDGLSPSAVYRTQRGAIRQLNVPYQSRAENNGCNNTVGTTNLIEVFANDEIVTGVPNSAPVGPLVLGLP